MIGALGQTLRFILNHPLNRRRRIAALARYVRWQVGSRLTSTPVVVDFVNGAKLAVRPGMTGATANIYVGLGEFADMGFVLHLLRAGDRFCDIGANVGAYSVLAASVGAAVDAFEPAPATYRALLANIAVNRFEDRITARQAALAAQAGTVRFTTEHDTVNHVAVENEAAVVVPAVTLDSALAFPPLIIKIDVEGYETEALAGATATLSNPGLLAVIMELNGSGARYGFDEAALHRSMLGYGFSPFAYDPLKRSLTALDGKNAAEGNTLYIRDVEAAKARITSAPSTLVHGVSF